MKSILNALLLVAGVAISAPSVVFAEATAASIPREPRLVVYQYDNNLTYAVVSAPGMVTDIALGADEKLQAFALGDTVQWVPAKTDGHVFLKPTVEGLATTGTLITDKRTYQLSIRSVNPTDNNWHQRVSWSYPDILLFERQKQAVEKKVEEEEKKRVDDTVVSRGVSVESLNFDYTVSGDAQFKPVTVFDDGRFTWLRLRNVQEMPAVFLLTDGATGELVNYQVKDNYIVINRLIPGALLKLGKEEVRVVNGASAAKKRKSQTWSPWE